MWADEVTKRHILPEIRSTRRHVFQLFGRASSDRRLGHEWATRSVVCKKAGEVRTRTRATTTTASTPSVRSAAASRLSRSVGRRGGRQPCRSRSAAATSLASPATRFRDLYRGRAAVEREFGRLKHDYGLAPLRVRGLERVRLHTDLTMLGRLGQALLRARAVPLAA